MEPTTHQKPKSNEHIVGEAVFVVDLLNLAEQVPNNKIEFVDEYGELWCIYKQHKHYAKTNH